MVFRERRWACGRRPNPCLSAAGRPVVASLWPVRSLPPLFLWASETFLQAAAWPRKLFLWASEGDVRDPRAPPSNPPRQPAGLPRPLCGLSEACPFSSPTGPARKRSCRPQLGPESFFYGLPKATLETHGPRPQTPLGSWQACLSLLMVFRERRWACGRPPNPSRQLAGLPLGSRQACCGLSVACPKPASSLLMGFRRRR